MTRRTKPQRSFTPRYSRDAWTIGMALLWIGGCGGHETGDEEKSRVTSVPAPPPSMVVSALASAMPSGTVAPKEPVKKADLAAEEADYTGPMLGAMAFQTPIYPETRFTNERLGYIRQGGRVPVDPNPIQKANCKQGWYKLLAGGFVCGKYATTDLENPRVRLGVKTPDLEGILPYKYAYNRFHGTPLYKALPTRDEMAKYEPHLLEDKKKEEEKKSGGDEDSRKKAKHVPPAASDAEQASAVPKGEDALAQIAAVKELDVGTPESPEEAAATPPKAWWQNGDEKGVNVTLDELEKDADGNLAKRMVKGFFIAIDKTFAWNGRSYFRTTNGLVAPVDRMWINKPPESKGIDYPEGAKGVIFVLSDKAKKYQLDKDRESAKEKDKVARFSGFGLTGEKVEIDDTLYRETKDGFWLKDSQCAITEPGKRPSDVGASERWVDVNIAKKTLVLFEGDKPIYAALVSPGKHARNKKKDHSTPTGSWRVREKHVAVTMDGDGASGDLPYSIDDVPYVAYFHGSYALHGAFWHSNFGREMSHGCVNLSPNDAKVVFQFVEPRLPRGWHAAWSTKDRPGSMIVVHE